MSTEVQRRRGTTAQHATFTGAAGELTVDTDKNTVVVHDGSTAGGHPLPTVVQGTYTPVLSFSGASTGITYTTQVGAYSVYAGLCTVSIRIILSSKGTAVGDMEVSLPFTAATRSPVQSGILRLYTTAYSGGVLTYVSAGASIASNIKNNGGANAFLTDADIIDTSIIDITLQYEI